MKIHPDTFGLYLMDAHRGRDVPHIIERDDGHINTSINSTHTYFSAHSEWPQPEQQAIAHAHGTVLDVGCGAGRHSLYLQSQGRRVIAVDISPLVVQMATERGVKNAFVSDASSVAPGERIDTILLLGNGLGLFGTPLNAKAQLARYHGFTGDEATIIMDSVDPHASTNPSHTAYHRRNRRKGLLIGQIRIRHRYEVYASPWFDFFMASLDETQCILEGTGWTIQETINAGDPHYWMILRKD
jgi:SAM-dependent methyltransferase